MSYFDELSSDVTINSRKMTSRTYIVDVETGDIVSKSVGSFDKTVQAGTRTTQGTPTLCSLCERFVVENKKLFDKRAMVSLVHLGLARASSNAYGIDSSLLAVPRVGRRFRLVKSNSANPPVEIFLKTITLAALQEACVESLKVKSEDVDVLSCADPEKYVQVEILTDDQVSMLAADSTIALHMVETPEEIAARLQVEAEDRDR